MSKKNQSCAVSCVRRKTSIGGQALMEGIMMRGPEMTAMAVRNPEGEIVLEKSETPKNTRSKFFKLPIIRGVFNFVDSMRAGYKCLMRSAEISGLEELEREAEAEKKAKKEAKKAKKAQKSAAEPVAPASTSATEEAVIADPVVISETSADSSEPAKATEKENEKDRGSSALTGMIMVIGTVLGICLAVFLFMMLPSYAYKGLENVLPFLPIKNDALNSLVKSVFEGVIRIAILVIYMLLVSLMKDIRRTFQYHGAEHKTIFCYENALPLTVENVRIQRRFHPRCGTSFLILMLLVSIVISFFIDPLFLLAAGTLPPTIIRVLIKIVLIPLMMGIGYELIKLAGRYDNLFIRIISAPGLWLQRITVLEPDDSMIECAIKAFVEVIPSAERAEEEEKIRQSQPEEAPSEATTNEENTAEA